MATYNQDFYNSLLVQTCTIQRASITTSATGTKTRSWSNLATGVSCLIQNIRSDELVTVEAGVKMPLTYRGFFKASQDIQEGDQVIWNSRTLLVKQAPPEDSSGTDFHKEVIMEQVSGQ